MIDIKRIKLIILDVDGVLSIAGQPIAGALTAVQQVTQAGLLVRYLTNDAFNSRAQRASSLSSLGFDVAVDYIYTAASLTAETVRSIPNVPRTLFVGCGEAKSEFSGVHLVSTNPEIVVVGDCSSGISIDLLNTGMLALSEGALFFAMQRNRTFPSLVGTRIDCGFWVAGLEYCVRRKATVVGKPSKYSYMRVCSDCKVLPADALMVSDSIEPDLCGAKAAGLSTAYISTKRVTGRSALYLDLTFESLERLATFLVSSRP